MSNSDQKIINFDYEKNFNDEDYYISNANKHIYDLLNKWPNWEKNFLNISGEKFSGKSHLMNIFFKRFGGFQIDCKSFKNDDLVKVKNFKNIILEDINKEIDEKLFFTLINIIEQDNRYLITTSKLPIVNIHFDLIDLKSRTKNFLLQNIEKPDDELMFALILKNLSDRQIFIDRKLIEYSIKRIDRSYGKIFEFIYKIDEMSLKKKEPINLKIIKKILGE